MYIELRHLRTIRAIHQAGGLARAADILNMTQSAVSHQLRILKQNKLVKARRDGKSIFYSLADDHVRTIISMGREHILE